MLLEYKNKKGITFMEVLIVITLIAALVIGGIVLLDPKRQIEKAWDAKRKADISTLRKILEEYYNDKGTYPTDIICDDEPQRIGNVCSCTICSLKKSSISSYFNTAYCDPQHPKRSYIYQYDCSSNSPQWYQICGILSFPPNAADNNQYDDGYNFGFASPNKQFTYCVQKCPSDADGSKYCWKTADPIKGIKACNNCGTFADCILNNACDEPVQLYVEPGCVPITKCSTTIE